MQKLRLTVNKNRKFWSAASGLNYSGEKTSNNEDSDENNVFNDIENGLTSVGDDIGKGVGDVGEGIVGDGES